MNIRRHVLEAATLIVAAVLCAVVANALASRDRKVQLAGSYPNALTVPPVQTTAPPPPIAPPAPVPTTTTVAPQPVPAPVVATTSSAPATPRPATHAPRPAEAQPAPPDVLSHFQPHEKVAYVEIGYDDVAKLHAAGALFLDARRTSVYEEGHIAGARPFSVWESDIDDKVNKLFAERSDLRDQAKPIVAYCSGGDCEDSHMLAQKLWGIQFNNVYVYKDGFPDWQKHGGAVHVGGNP